MSGERTISGERPRSAGGRRARLFTRDEANRMLPLVRAIVADLADLARDVAERRQRIAHLVEGRELESSDPYAEELVLVRDQLVRDDARIEEYTRELEDLGLELKSGPLGVVSFPSELEGRRVHLSWRLGESELLYWHAPTAVWTGRQPLSTIVLTDSSAPASSAGSPGSELAED